MTWPTLPLRRLAKVRNGVDHSAVRDDDGAYPVYGSGGAFARSNTPLYSGPSVLLGRKGTINKPLMVDGDFWTVDTMFCAQPLPDTNPRFLYYAATMIPFDLLTTNTALPSMTQSDLNAVPLPYPPVNEQAKIVDFLDGETAKIDALVDKQQQLVATLREDRTFTITHAVTKGLNPDAEMKDSGVEWLGEIPVSWTSAMTLKRVATVHTGVTLGKPVGVETTVKVPYLRVANVQTSKVDLEEVKTLALDPKEVGRYLLQRGDVLMTEGGDIDKLGRGCLWDAQIRRCIHQNHIFAVRCHRRLSAQYLVYLLDTVLARNYFYMTAKKTTNLASTNSTTLGNFSFPLPGRHEQDEIVAFLNRRCTKIDALIAKATEMIATLREYRSALITAAVTGKIDVREAVSA